MLKNQSVSSGQNVLIRRNYSNCAHLEVMPDDQGYNLRAESPKPTALIKAIVDIPPYVDYNVSIVFLKKYLFDFFMKFSNLWMSCLIEY